VHPVLPPNGLALARHYGWQPGALRERLGDRFRPWAVTSYPSVGGSPPAGHGFVVTAAHPGLFPQLDTPQPYLETLRKMGARQVAAFDGAPTPLPPGVVFDPIDADYVPLRGWNALRLPGPNLTIWELPASR
jgi:hypothetical protein